MRCLLGRGQGSRRAVGTGLSHVCCLFAGRQMSGALAQPNIPDQASTLSQEPSAGDSGSELPGDPVCVLSQSCPGCADVPPESKHGLRSRPGRTQPEARTPGIRPRPSAPLEQEPGGPTCFSPAPGGRAFSAGRDGYGRGRGLCGAGAAGPARRLQLLGVRAVAPVFKTGSSRARAHKKPPESVFRGGVFQRRRSGRGEARTGERTVPGSSRRQTPREPTTLDPGAAREFAPRRPRGPGRVLCAAEAVGPG